LGLCIDVAGRVCEACDSIFKAPFGGFMQWLGGIAIDRSRANNTVEQMVECYRTSPELILLIPPEGTRSKVKRWKTGFYHIAQGADVPIMLGYIDAATKTVGFGDFFTPTGNIEADMQRIQQFYADKQGIRPELF
jgi:1-acyl-sn-glycerol-3-phosphate acyltransferase